MASNRKIIGCYTCGSPSHISINCPDDIYTRCSVLVSRTNKTMGTNICVQTSLFFRSSKSKLNKSLKSNVFWYWNFIPSTMWSSELETHSNDLVTSHWCCLNIHYKCQKLVMLFASKVTNQNVTQLQSSLTKENVVSNSVLPIRSPSTNVSLAQVVATWTKLTEDVSFRHADCVVHVDNTRLRAKRERQTPSKMEDTRLAPEWLHRWCHSYRSFGLPSTSATNFSRQCQ